MVISVMTTQRYGYLYHAKGLLRVVIVIQSILEMITLKTILILTTLSNLFIVDDDLVRTRPTGGYRKEYGT